MMSSTIHPAIKIIAEIQQEKLNVKQERYPVIDGLDNWLKSTINDLEAHFLSEVKEFLEEIEKIKSLLKDYEDKNASIDLDALDKAINVAFREGADVNNLSMMLLEKLKYITILFRQGTEIETINNFHVESTKLPELNTLSFMDYGPKMKVGFRPWKGKKGGDKIDN